MPFNLKAKQANFRCDRSLDNVTRCGHRRPKTRLRHKVSSATSNMVGKIKHVRQKIHQQAVRLDGPSGHAQPPDSGAPLSLEKPLPSQRHATCPPFVGKESGASSTDVKKVRKHWMSVVRCGISELRGIKNKLW